MATMKLLAIALFLGIASCSPMRNFKEIEYDIPLLKAGDHKSYFIKKSEMPVYEQQFAKIRELGEKISCKITGNCQGSKRGYISKKSMFDMPGGDPMMASANAMMEPTGSIGGEDVSAAMMGGQSSFMSGPKQPEPAMFGQQPQMDIKMGEKETAAIQAGMGGMGPGAVGPMMGSSNDALLKLREQQNSQIIEGSIQDKLNFMSKALGGGPPAPPGMPGVSDPLNQFQHSEGKDETNPSPNGVSESDLMKAEDIQPNEMKGIDTFLKDSNHVERQPGESFINDSPAEDSFMGKTNVDFGGSQSSIENQEKEAGGEPPLGAAGPMPVAPGGPEVPTLMNLGLGMNPAEMGPPGTPPNFGFIQDSTRQMIQQNSDYKVPQTAFSNMWNSYMSSTQSLLGERDPSANSRHSIFRPVKLHRRSNVEKPQKKSLNDNPKKANLVYVPAFVIKNVLNQVKKSLKALPPDSHSASHIVKKNEPPIFITEKHGKRFLVINPDNPMIQGFANVDDQFTSFQMPTFNTRFNSGFGSGFSGFSRGSFGDVNGFPSVALPEYPSQSISFGSGSDFPVALGGPYSGRSGYGGFPLLGGQTDSGGIFRGFVAVPIATRIPNFGSIGNNFFPSYINRSPLYMNHISFPESPIHRYAPALPMSRFDQPAPVTPFYGRNGLGNEGVIETYPAQNINLDDGGAINNNQNTDFQNMFGGLFGQRSNFDGPSPSPVYGDNEQLPQKQPFYGNNMFGGLFGQRSNFDRPSPSPVYGDNEQLPQKQPFYGNNIEFKRSHPTPPHPYVFTKEHVGFGPITVEAHTASYKGDPKEDE